MNIAWTTVATQEQASLLAKAIIENKLAACVQISSPIESYYQWNGEMQIETEYRMIIKCLESQTLHLEQFVKENHPYTCPQWIVVSSISVSKEYLAWAEESAGN